MRVRHIAALAVLVSLSHCRTHDGDGPRDEIGAPTDAEGEVGDTPFYRTLPTITNPTAFMDATGRAVSRAAVPPAQQADYARRLARYLAFLGLKPGSAQAKTILSRLASGSIQFLICDRPLDWACLEATPRVRPASAHRRDVSPEIGEPLDVPGTFSFEYYFTEQWNVPAAKADPKKMLALRLAEKIKNDGKTGVWMALYGIDDTAKSMKPVYDALVDKVTSKVPLYGVFDTEGVREVEGSSRAPAPLIYSLGPNKSKQWIFAEQAPGKHNMAFQYGNTVDLIKAMNREATTPAKAPGRLEWPDDGIMHNKFFVLENKKKMTVWTGTTNVSETCMGTERNTNMALYIKSNEIAQAFKTEFEEMHAFRPELLEEKELRTPAGSDKVAVGSFHRGKTANTRRYFRFGDGTDVHVHFAPTDDGEHRIIHPLLLGAKAGDEIRVAMFGGGGFELVRAFQYAVAQGAHVKIILDTLVGASSYSWIKAADANLTMPNPYKRKPTGTLEVRLDRIAGLNHHKTATFTRAYPGGVKKAEVLVVGSQNWSKQGNDENDENMVTIVKQDADLAAAAAFNKHFDTQLWANAVAYDPAAASASSFDPAEEAAAAEAQGWFDE